MLDPLGFRLCERRVRCSGQLSPFPTLFPFPAPASPANLTPMPRGLIWSAFKRMPIGLRLITGLCLLMSVFLPMAFLPFVDFTIDDTPVSFGEFWRRGGGLVFCVTGTIFAFLAYGFILARRWARFVFIIAGCAITLKAVLDDHKLKPDNIIVFLLLIAVPAWYLFFRRSVTDYFSQSSDTASR